MRSAIERFEEKFMPEPNSGCWLWLACVSNRTGYGKFGLAKDDEVGAHRASWRLYRGDIPLGMVVMHKCDVRICVNPDHLKLGTQADNIADKMAKGREARGTRVCTAKLTDDLVRKIRADPRTLDVISSEYGMDRNHIWRIRRRISWKHVD